MHKISVYNNPKFTEILPDAMGRFFVLATLLSNFLSTQLNTQSSILQLINKINEQGFLDDSTKKIFEDLNQSIQELKAKNKK